MSVKKTRVLRNRLFYLLKEYEQKLERRITYKELAENLGVTEHTIGSWMRNDVRRIDAEMIERFCNFFECDLGDLLYFKMEEIDDNRIEK